MNRSATVAGLPGEPSRAGALEMIAENPLFLGESTKQASYAESKPKFSNEAEGLFDQIQDGNGMAKMASTVGSHVPLKVSGCSCESWGTSLVVG